MESHAIRLSGKAELPEPLPVGSNFSVMLDGSVVSETISDNDDGSKSHTYLFKPVIVEAIKKTGERIKAKDTRSRSQQLRSLIFKNWRQENSPIEFEDYYDQEMLKILSEVGKLYT